MNVLLLTQFFSDTRGGGEYLFYTLATALAEKGHHVWVITNKIKNENITYHNNVKIIFVPPVLDYQGGLPPSIKENMQYLWNAIKISRKIIKEYNIDIIHSNNFTPALTGSIISTITKKNHITSIWDIFTLCGCDYWKKWVSQTRVSKINQIIGPMFEKLILKSKCNAFHTISNASKEDIKKYNSKKPIYMIPPTLHEINEIKLVKNNKQFVCVGRLVFYKNVEVLIKAMNIIKDKEIKLVIVGGGPHLSTIKNLIKELQLEKSIIIKGYVNAEEKLNLISESNAMLFPSLCEGFGLVILEAFTQKIPVLVSDLKPMSDIIEHKKTGFVIKSNDEKIWADYILELAHNPEKSKQMGAMGNEILKSKYNKEKFYNNMIGMYNDLI